MGGSAWIIGCGALCPLLGAQQPGLGAPVIAAHVKGPDQINLTWPPVVDRMVEYLNLDAIRMLGAGQ